jgi:hypothetical protein
MNYYYQYPAGIDGLNRLIGYRLRPAWIWTYGDASHSGLIVGLSNRGISGVPGVVRLSLLDQSGRILAAATLDPGHPTPHQVRLIPLALPPDSSWEGTRLRAELIVKGVLHPIRWACRESVNPDGSLTLKRSAVPL